MNLGNKGGRLFHCDDGGFSTTGMVVALLVSLSLIFTCAQVYRINEVSAKVQNVADSAALAALNEVAEFQTAVQVCDAVVLSLSLAGLTATGLGLVALCVPPAQGIGASLLKAGRNVMDARDSFARKAAAGLDKIQKALPFLAAFKAVSVAEANSSGSSRYLAIALLEPSKGEPIEVGASDAAREAQNQIEQEADDIKKAAKEAEEALEKANELKNEAYQHDCGNNPGYCMYQRAETLAGMTGGDNPYYSSVDTWSFSTALERAKRYYARRLSLEEADGASVSEQARSALRKRFYRYASEKVSEGYVHMTGAFSAWFPRLPRNTEEMRDTELYDQVVYPKCMSEDGKATYHAWGGCPGIRGAVEHASMRQMESGEFELCPECEFRPSSMGRVASASTSIDNGFEYHYLKVAEAADEYQKAMEKAEPLQNEVKGAVDGLLDGLKDACASVAGMRIKAKPPGTNGVVVLAADCGGQSASEGFASSFVPGGKSMGPKVAVSAATLLADPAEDGSSVITGLLEGLPDAGASAVGPLGMALSLWSDMLLVYTKGQDAVDDALRTATADLPLSSLSGLGDWAADSLKEAIGSVVLDPPKMDALKPVLVNSGHVASQGSGSACAKLIEVKRQATANARYSVDPFSTMVDDAQGKISDRLNGLDGEVTVATVEVEGLGEVPLTVKVALPEEVKSQGLQMVDDAAQAFKDLAVSVTGIHVWQ